MYLRKSCAYFYLRSSQMKNIAGFNFFNLRFIYVIYEQQLDVEVHVINELLKYQFTSSNLVQYTYTINIFDINITIQRKKNYLQSLSRQPYR